MQQRDYTGPEQIVFWRQALGTPSFVYFIQASDGPVKIGKARDPLKRMATLQTGSPAPLHLRAVVPGGVSLEHALHRRFSTLQLLGEWFDDPLVLIYGEGLARAAIDAYDESGEAPELTGSEFRTAREVRELRSELERMWNTGYSLDEILLWSKLAQQEFEDQLAAMKASTLYELKRPSAHSGTRHESMSIAAGRAEEVPAIEVDNSTSLDWFFRLPRWEQEEIDARIAADQKAARAALKAQVAKWEAA